jgi:hypothetical protein
MRMSLRVRISSESPGFFLFSLQATSLALVNFMALIALCIMRIVYNTNGYGLYRVNGVNICALLNRQYMNNASAASAAPGPFGNRWGNSACSRLTCKRPHVGAQRGLAFGSKEGTSAYQFGCNTCIDSAAWWRDCLPTAVYNDSLWFCLAAYFQVANLHYRVFVDLGCWCTCLLQ